MKLCAIKLLRKNEIPMDINLAELTIIQETHFFKTHSRLKRLIQDQCKIALQPTAYDRLYEESLEVQRLAGEGNISDFQFERFE